MTDPVRGESEARAVVAGDAVEEDGTQGRVGE